MKIVAYYGIHYGIDWLEWSMRSVAPFVSEIALFYSLTPSHGHSTAYNCPESMDDVYQACVRGSKYAKEHDCAVIWYDCPHFAHEGEHRTYAVDTCEKDHDADLILVVDADELWHPTVLENAIAQVKKGNTRNYGVGARHFWRSLKWVCDDPAMPVRFIKPGIKANTVSYISGKFFHMGYAQNSKIIWYKQHIHGHKNEWRSGWYEHKFLKWKPGDTDVHPTNIDYWTPMQYADDGELEEVCGDHPYWGMDKIIRMEN